MKRPKADDGYVPLTWTKDDTLPQVDRDTIDAQRKDLWRGGIRTEPLLTRMAFEFAAVIAMQRAAKKAGLL
jgi:hypothetical protein